MVFSNKVNKQHGRLVTTYDVRFNHNTWVTQHYDVRFSHTTASQPCVVDVVINVFNINEA